MLLRACWMTMLAPYLLAHYAFITLRRTLIGLRRNPRFAFRTFISPNLLVGGFLWPWEVGALTRESIAAVVNVTNELIDPVRALERAGMAYLRVPCWDRGVPSTEDTLRGVAFIAEHVTRGRRVYVHCANGVGRSITLVVCYLALHEGRDVRAVLDVIRRQRSHVSLSRAQHALLDRFQGMAKGRLP